MEPVTTTPAYASSMIWIAVGVIWLLLTFAALRLLMRSSGRARISAFVVAVCMVWVATVPVFSYLLLFFLAFGSSAIEGPVGIGVPAIIGGAVMAALFAITLAGILVRRSGGRA